MRSAQDGSTCHDYCSPGQEHLWGHISQLVPFQLVPEVFLPIAQTFNEDDDDDGGDDDDDESDGDEMKAGIYNATGATDRLKLPSLQGPAPPYLRNAHCKYTSIIVYYTTLLIHTTHDTLH